MKRSLTLIALLATMLLVEACGGSDTGRSERADPVEPRQTQAASDRQSAAREEATRKGAPANDEAAQEDPSSSGLSVTTIEGEQVNLGGQGAVTALYFMAGW